LVLFGFNWLKPDLAKNATSLFGSIWFYLVKTR